MGTFVAIVAHGPVTDLDAALVTSQTLAAKHDVVVQLVDADAVFNQRHLDAAWIHAERARDQDTMSAKSFGAEFLLYLCGERQVGRALEKAGIREGTARIVIVASGARAGTVVWGILDKLGWSRDPAGIPPRNPATFERLGWTVPTGSDPEDAVLERVALVDVAK
jgi:tRNA threonylcarbamoyladenosine modification (KEOPS) complex Cgi121 subunit